MDKVKLAGHRQEVPLLGIFALRRDQAPIGWWFAASSLAEQCIAKKTGLAKLFTNVTQQFGVSNQRCIDAIRTKEVDFKEGSLQAEWNVLYKEQQKNNPLPDVLGPEFTKEYKELPSPVTSRNGSASFTECICGSSFPPCWRSVTSAAATSRTTSPPTMEALRNPRKRPCRL